MINLSEKQPSVISNRSADGRFARGNRIGYQPDQSGNPEGRPLAMVEKVEMRDRLTERGQDQYRAAGRLLDGKLRRDPELRINLMQALRILRDELKALES